MLLSTLTCCLIAISHFVPVESFVQSHAPWHLARLSAGKNWPPEEDEDMIYQYNAGTKQNVYVYLLDTGIDKNHPEFSGRVRMGPHLHGRDAEDDNGHGTHIAGIIASTTYGVAKKAKLISVKVASAMGSGLPDDKMNALKWIQDDVVKASRVIVCIPGSARYSDLLNKVVNETVMAGIPVIVGAGDWREMDTSELSPASAELAYTVAASDFTDNLAGWSSKGRGVNMMAPGEDITSTWFAPYSQVGKLRGTKTFSGTAQATGVVCGLAAYFRSQGIGTESPEALYNQLNAFAMRNMLDGVPKYMSNLLAQNNFGAR